MGKEIFILEDDKDIGFILNHVLFEQGYKVSVYENLSDIRQGLDDHLPDLLLMDVRLPDGNGLDLCAELKSAEGDNLPILMMSADLDVHLNSVCVADEFIAKPFDLDVILGKIEFHLRQAG